MKLKNELLSFGLVVLLLSSCFCKDEYQVAYIEIEYQNLSSATNVFLIREQNTIQDTQYIESLTPEENTLSLLNLQENSNKRYIIYLEAFNHSDTITDFTVKRGKCDGIKSYSFDFNGVKKTDNKITVSL